MRKTMSFYCANSGTTLAEKDQVVCVSLRDGSVACVSEGSPVPEGYVSTPFVVREGAEPGKIIRISERQSFSNEEAVAASVPGAQSSPAHGDRRTAENILAPLVVAGLPDSMSLAEVRELRDQIADALSSVRRDYEEVFVGHRERVRLLDAAMNGDGAANQASLVDIWDQLLACVRKATTGRGSPWFAIARWRHRRRETCYDVLTSVAQAQCSTGPIAENDYVTVYKADDATWWVRKTDEFRDGRFERIDLTEGWPEKK